MSQFQSNFCQKQGMVLPVQCRERQLDLVFEVLSIAIGYVHARYLANLRPRCDILPHVAQNDRTSTRHVIRGI